MDAEGSRWQVDDLLGEAKWLASLARELVADRALAEDVAQETWVAALRKPPERGTPLRPWLTRVAKNAMRQQLRSDARRMRRERVLAVPEGEQVSGPEELSARLEGQRLLVAALGELREPYRSTVLLVYFDGKASAEVARASGVPEGTVRWRLKQAIDELRARLDVRSNGDRRAWALVVAPLARSAPQGHVVTWPSVIAGLLAMSTMWKVAVASSALLLLTAGLTIVGVIDVPFRSRSDAAAAPVVAAAQPRTPADAPERRDVAATTSPGHVREVVPTPVAAPGVPVLARFVDERRAGVGGVRVATQPEVKAGTPPPASVTAVSAADGRVELRLRSVEAVRAAGRLRVEHEAHATRFVDLPEHIEAQAAKVDLGDIELKPGGSVAGFVRDRDGVPVGGAPVGPTNDDYIGADREQLRRAPFPLWAESAVKTDARGAYALSGVPAGRVVLATGCPGFLATLSDPVEVPAGQTANVDLVLDRVPADESVDGVVLAPSGMPQPRAQIRWRVTGMVMASGTQETDESGRFAFTVAPGAVLDLEAEAPDRSAAVASAREVKGATHGLELRLAIARKLALSVTDTEGLPIGEFSACFAPLRDGPVPERERSWVKHSGGSAELALPAQPARLLVEAEGYRGWDSGKLEPGSAPKALTVKLDSVPRLTGRVRIAGQPAPGVRVTVLHVSGDHLFVNGFPSRNEPGAVAGGATDAGGAFAFTIRDDSIMVVRAERDGHAPAESEPIEFSCEHGGPDVELELTSGGTIAGRVTVPPGASAAGRIVAFSCGDGFAFTQRTDERGEFRAEHLRPGPWYVVCQDEEIDGKRPFTSRARGARFDKVPTNCTVTEGETLRLEVPSERPPGKYRIAGRITLDGVAQKGWTATLGDVNPHKVPDAQARTDEAGRFEIGCEMTGTTHFMLQPAPGALPGLFFRATVEVDGTRTEWQGDLRLASLVIEVQRTGDRGIPRPLVITAHPGLHALAQIPLEQGEHKLAIVAGTVKTIRVDQPEKAGLDIGAWPAAQSITVAPGETGRLRVP